MDDFINHNAPTKAIIFDYYMNFIPYFANLFSPMFIFIAAVYFTSRMAANTEIVAMLTSGINFYRLLVPYFIVAALFVGLTYYLYGWVIPKSNAVRVEFDALYLKDPYRYSETHIHRRLGPNEFVYMKRYNNNDHIGTRFSYEKFDGINLKYKLLSDRVVWNEDQKNWTAERYVARTIDSLNETITRGDTITLNIPLSPSDFSLKTADIQTMSSPQLRKFIKEEYAKGEDTISYEVELVTRSAVPFAIFIMVLIAFSIASRKLRGGIGFHLLYGFIIAAFFAFMQRISSVLSINGGWDAALSVWLPNFIFAILGVFLLIKAQK